MGKSAGILLFKKSEGILEVFLVHPGGPFWKAKDLGSWSIPKGEFTADEEALPSAIREFKEETGSPIWGEFIELSPVKLKSGKWIYAWAVEGDIEASKIVSNTFLLEWPPRSGKQISLPEVDKGDWFTPDEARIKINSAQAALIDQLEKIVDQKT
ncbi:MAG: NUDIX domain-containing protein [Flavisolibacter sp.]|nr:NUDIX domain-containing protein [Flavisolibacter sp.]